MDTRVYPNTQLFINGEWRAARSGRTMPVVNPATGDTIGSIAGRIKQFGRFVMLVPSSVELKGDEPPEVPLPKPRPNLVAEAQPPATHNHQ